MKYSSAEQLIGNTPLVELGRFSEKQGLSTPLLAKLESANPTGSAKDRAALYMILDAEKSGRLRAGGTVIEPTSGNTGIGLAAVAAIRGYRAVIVMPDSMSQERRAMIAAYGAEIVLTPGSLGMTGAVSKAQELEKSIPGAVITGQFENPANARAHFETTGPEILRDTDGKVDFLVAGVGTGGTLTGCGRYLKQHIHGLTVIAVEPKGSPLLSKGKAGGHKIQGIGANFVPDVLDRSVYDEVMTVSDGDAYAFTKQLVQTEGLLCGISSGAALCAAATALGRAENRGKTAVVILPDSGNRYLSVGLF